MAEISLSPELHVLRDVIARLESAGLDYMLTGSMAASYYATPRMTRDIDFVVELDRERLDGFIEIFRDAYYVPENMSEAVVAPGMFNLLHLASMVKVDIVVRKHDEFRQVEFSRRARVDFGGFDGFIVSREDLILSKLVWAQPSGSELQMRDVQNLSIGTVDRVYLEHWARRLGVDEALASVLS